MASTEEASPQEVETVIPATRVTWGQYFTEHPVSRWTNEDVQAWLVEVGLPHLAPVFARLNGDALLSLSDRLVDEVLSTNNSAVKELGSAYQAADKVIFKLHFDSLRASSPLIYKIWHFFTTIFTQLPTKVHTEIINKISSKTVETLLKYVALGAATVATSYIAAGWVQPTRSKKRDD
jgi:hypothetical protein